MALCWASAAARFWSSSSVFLGEEAPIWSGLLPLGDLLMFKLGFDVYLLAGLVTLIGTFAELPSAVFPPTLVDPLPLVWLDLEFLEEPRCERRMFFTLLM